MSLSIPQTEFEAEHYSRFSERLRQSLAVLDALLSRPGFGDHAPSLGAELELSIVDPAGRALPLNRAVLAESLDPQLQLELDRFNLEYNLTPVPCAGRPFAALEAEMRTALADLDRVCANYRGRVAPIGILPTLEPVNLEPGAMTDLPRYHALSAGIRRLRRDPFRIEISGEDRLELAADDVTVEGATTSLQIHLRVRPQEFADLYNATQLATPLALAVSANSPTLLGHRLWDETRVALFKQSVDSRPQADRAWRPPARVSFGHGWNRGGAHELFAEAVALFPPLLPVLGDEDPTAVFEAGAIPRLAELRLHQGTVWRWNRAIFDPADGGHLRIEMRSLPSGPAPVDMVAGAAFHVGLAAGLAGRMRAILPSFPFEYAHWNFYRAAQQGLSARLLWPCGRSPSPEERDVVDLIRESLPWASEGLDRLGVASAEAERLLGIISARVESGVTPARWQRRQLDALEPRVGLPEALARMLEGYLVAVKSNRPIHEWSGLP